jgi:hypothetical protein
MKTRFNSLAKSAGFPEGDHVWFYGRIRTSGKSRKLQSSWESPYMMIALFDDVYRIRRLSKAKVMVVHLNRLAQYLGSSQDEQP